MSIVDPYIFPVSVTNLTKSFVFRNLGRSAAFELHIFNIENKPMNCRKTLPAKVRTTSFITEAVILFFNISC